MKFQIDGDSIDLTPDYDAPTLKTGTCMSVGQACDAWLERNAPQASYRERISAQMSAGRRLAERNRNAQ